MVLMMASYGARGKTADEMTAVLHFDNENIVQKNGINYLIDNFNVSNNLSFFYLFIQKF